MAITTNAFAANASDVRHNRGLRLIAALLILSLLGTAVGLGVIYYGDSFAVPAWDDYSVPPPKPY